MKSRSSASKGGSGRSAAETTRGRFTVKVQPGSSRDTLSGKTGEAWKVAVTAPPVEGRANRACIELLARTLGVARSAVVIVRGQSSRVKLIEVEGLSSDQIGERLAASAPT